MVAAAVSRIGLLLLAVIIGQRFGPSDLGAFVFATSAALLASQIAGLGWPTLMNLQIPKMRASKDWEGLKGLRDAGDVLVFGSSVVLALLLLVSSRWAGDLEEGVILAAILTVPSALAVLRRQQLAALKLPALGLLFDQSIGAYLTVAFIFAVGGGSIVQTVVFFACATLLGNFVTTAILHKKLPPELSAVRRSVRLRDWISVSIPMFLGGFSRLIMTRIDTLMLAPLAGLSESGLYGAAFRITFLLTFPQMVMLSVLTPIISEAFAEERYARLKRIMKGASLLSMVTAVPVSVLLIAFPGAIMGLLFGDEFRSGAETLVLLSFAQLATSLALPFQVMLTMGGHERKFGGLSLCALVLQVVLNLILIPLYGAVGVAASTLTVSVLLAAGQIGLCLPLLRRW